MPQWYGPKGELSPSLGVPCPLCGTPFAVDDYTTFVSRAGDETRRRYSNRPVEVHWGCAFPDVPYPIIEGEIDAV